MISQKQKNLAKKVVTCTLIAFLTFPSAVATAPVKTTELIPMGITTGIKLFTDGVMIIGSSLIKTESGDQCPGLDAGLKEGDMITRINGADVTSNEKLQEIIEKSQGSTLNFEVKRSGETVVCKVTPVKSQADGKMRIGVWVRDSMAGIGTITFIDPERGLFAALGHGICDIDTNQLMPISYGSIMESKVAGVKKGEVGDPGELKGEFNLKSDSGQILLNADSGLFGILDKKELYSGLKAIPAATNDEIKTGSAVILSNIEGNRVDRFSIEIIKIYNENEESQRNMMIKITDPRLLEKTGGIVQGMSGSPILQNGKIIGAVTHVLVNDPQKGYAITVENMLKTLNNVAKQKSAA